MKIKDVTLEGWVRRAQEIATVAHESQKRNDGSPYIKHPTRVANAVEDRLKPIAWLHDVVEDTPTTLENLKAEGFPSYIIEAVDLLTHRKGEPNLSYWGKIKTNSDALAVKLADINDNVNDTPSEYSRQKYGLALSFFNSP
jgi:(p)ppGpp synthase/HD superfamily hydrolase